MVDAFCYRFFWGLVEELDRVLVEELVRVLENVLARENS